MKTTLSSVNKQLNHTSSSVRRISETGGGGPENLRITKTRIKIFQPKTTSVFLPKIRWREKKGVFSQKKRSPLKFSPILPQNYAKAKKRSSPTVFVLKPFAQVTKGGAMPQFCILIYANYTILATQKGGHGPMAPPLNTPLYTRYHSVIQS